MISQITTKSPSFWFLYYKANQSGKEGVKVVGHFLFLKGKKTNDPD